jgi:hypothetical protein
MHRLWQQFVHYVELWIPIERVHSLTRDGREKIRESKETCGLCLCSLSAAGISDSSLKRLLLNAILLAKGSVKKP